MGIKFLKSKDRQPIDYVTANVVPKKFAEFMYDLNFVFGRPNSRSYELVGRSKEISKIFNTFMQMSRKNVMLLGDRGVGKDALVEKVVYHVTKGWCPKELSRNHFLYLDTEGLRAVIDNKRYRRLLTEMIAFITSANNCVVVIDQIHFIENDLYLFNKIEFLLDSPNVKVIGISTENDFERYFAADIKTKLKFDVVKVDTPKPKQIFHMTRKVVRSLRKYHKVRIADELVQYVINISGAFSTELCNPALTLRIIENAMIYAKTHGEKEVSRKAINSYFNFQYSLYNKIPKEDRKRVAYHEAGHFIVQRFSSIKNLRTTAITIVPAEDFLGITSFEVEPEKQILMDIDYYIDSIAMDLGGRVAEGIYRGPDGDSKKYSSGAETDLVTATATAREIVTSYGMVENVGENMSYLGYPDVVDLYLLSDKIKNSIDRETKKLISKATKRATQILNDHLPLLERMAMELLKNDVLVKSDLDSICSEVEETTK